MIPKKLRLSAFGPYADEQIIDFSLFQRAGLFLIFGPTGAGKTAILDGMTYALYGKSSGGVRGDFTEMRCQYARAETETFVEFTFLHQEKEYEFRRFLKPTRKKNLEGFEEVASAGVVVEGTVQPFSANMKKTAVNAYAQTLLGLTCDQFCQVVLLPQGKFEKLLTSNIEEKEKILKTLFGTEHWAAAAQWLADQAAEKGGVLRSKRQALSALAADYETLGALAMEIEKLQEENDRLAQKQKQGETVREKLMAELEAAKALEELYLQWETLREKKEVLEQRKDEMDNFQHSLQDARRAERVYPLYAEWQYSKEELHSREERIAKEQEQREALLTGQKTLEQERREVPDMQKELEGLKVRTASLEQLRQGLREYFACTEQIKRAGAEVEEYHEKSGKVQREWESESGRLRSLEQQLLKAEAHGEQRFAELAQRIQILEKAVALDAELSELIKVGKQERVAQEQEMKAQTQLAAEAKELETRVRAEKDRLLQDAAALVASGLQEGEVCPVCGGSFHRVEVHCKTGELDGSELMRLEKYLQEKRDRLQKLDRKIAVREEKLSGYRAQLTSLRNQRQDVGESAEVEVLLREARAEYRTHEDVQKSIESLQTQRSDCGEKVAQMEQERDRLAAVLSEKKLELARLEERKAQMEQKLEGFDSEKTLGREIEGYHNRAEALAKKIEKILKDFEKGQLELARIDARLKHEGEELMRAQTKCNNQEKNVRQLLRRENFQSPEELCNAMMPSDKMEELDLQLKEYERACMETEREEERLNSAIDNRPNPDMLEITRKLALCEDSLAELKREYLEKAARLSGLKAISEKTLKLQGEINNEEPGVEMLTSFSTLLRGNNGMGIARFVMGVMLGAVTEEANRLLTCVHGGRYRLYRTAEGARRERKTGLNFQVFDGFSCKRRGVESLSGGEKFLLSLALSLGLSAFVERQTGGASIECMFVDEGFGTLDSASIGEALEMLASVKNSRRMVGIISHVHTLRDNIENAIEISKGTQGSRIKMHVQ